MPTVGSYNTNDAVAIITGSGGMQAGNTSHYNPRATFPTIIGKPRHAAIMNLNSHKDYYVGDEAMSKRGILDLTYPVENGMIKDFDAMSKIWHHAYYNEIRFDPEEHPLLLNEPPCNSMKNREKMAQIMFEELNVPALIIVPDPTLALVASCRTTGVVVDSGDTVTYVQAMYEGAYLPTSFHKVNIGGRDLALHMIKLIMETEHEHFPNLEICRDIKERMCYVAGNFEQEMERASTSTAVEKVWELPDGNLIKINSQRFRVPEVMFDPSIIGSESLGISEMIYQSIMKCDIDTRRDLFRSIILVGGNTMFEGFADRLQCDIQQLAPASVSVKVCADSSRKYYSWSGASIGVHSFPDHWILKQEYDEEGNRLVHQRSFAKCI